MTADNAAVKGLWSLIPGPVLPHIQERPRQSSRRLRCTGFETCRMGLSNMLRNVRCGAEQGRLLNSGAIADQPQ